MHDAEVNDSRDVAAAEDVLELLAPEIEPLVLDVLRLPHEVAPVDADDRALAVEHARDLPPEAAAHARDDDLGCGCVRRAPGWSALPGNHQNTCLRSRRPRLSIDCTVFCTVQTFASMTASSSSASPSKVIGSPK